MGGTESINSQRHAGTWDDSKFIMEMDGSAASLNIRDNYGRAVGLQIDNVDTTNTFSFNFETAGSSTNVLIEKCILRSGLQGSALWLTGSSATVRNCLIYCRGTPSGGNDGGTSIAGTNVIQYCTFLNLITGFENDGATPTLTNCIIFDTNNDMSGTITATYCATEDGDGSNAVTLANGTYAFSNIWTDYSGTPRDLSLVNNTSDTNAPQNKGTFISGLDEDIAGNDRDNSTPDIGCFEFVASGGETATCTDGFDFGDSTVNTAALLASLSDGVDFGDSTVRQAALLSLCSDGLSFSENNSGLASLLASMSDGFVFSDLSSTAKAILGQLLDGLVFADASTSIGSLIATGADGFTFSDLGSGKLSATVTISDGITIGDAATKIAAYLASCLDGVTFSDISFYPTDIQGVINISVVTKQTTLTVTVKRPGITVTTKQPLIDLEIDDHDY